MTMTPLKITASLYNGFAAADDWAPALDGILAYWHLRKDSPDAFLLAQGRDDLMTPVENLPLERVEDGGLWWYACSSPIYTLHQTHRQYFHRRFDDQYEKHLPETTKTVVTAGGPYKNYRKSIIFRVTREISWHVVGDAARITDLLNRCHHVGSKTAQGYGRVKEWRIDDGDDSLAYFRRPLPLSYAKKWKIEGHTMTWGIRPPARLPANSCVCVMPMGAG